jgi:fatty acid omega-hydroxylase
LYPSVPENQKYSIEDDVLPDGTTVPAGTHVSWSSYAQGRSTKIWGADAKEFKPERWINENGDLNRFSQGQWPAFHGGPRVCLGKIDFVVIFSLPTCHIQVKIWQHWKLLCV